MAIRILPNQIPQLWPAIKYVTTTVDRIEEKDRGVYLNNLLADLLNDKAQCFIRLGNDRQMMALAITKITVDEVSGDKVLVLKSLYSFQRTSESQWSIDAEVIKQYAIKSGCKRVVTQSSNPRVFELALANGFTERYRCFAMEV